MSRQKKCLYQKIIALVCLFAVCLTGFAAYFAIKNTGSVQAAEYTFTDSSGNQVGWRAYCNASFEGYFCCAWNTVQ